MDNEFKNIVSTDWLENHLESPDIRIIDASWYFPHEKRDAEAEFKSKHIPGTQFFDIDKIRDTSTSLPHMVPSSAVFNSKVRSMGIGDGHKIVIYDSFGIRSSPRVWWMFKMFGVKDVVVLDGGLPKWEYENRKLSAQVMQPSQRHFTVFEDRSILADKEDVLRAISVDHCLIIDARSTDRFLGKTPEPREGLRSGSIETSINIPFENLLNEDMTFRTKSEILNIFKKAGVSKKNPIITTCGSGVTAAILFLALHEIECSKLSLYDGSWAEWGLKDTDE